MGKVGNEADKAGSNLILKLCMFIVDKHVLFLLIFTILSIFSFFSSSWVKVEDDLEVYLPANSETRLGLDIMEREFDTYATMDVMIANISYDQALLVKQDLENINGVFQIEFDDSDKHYNNGSAFLGIVFDYGTKDDESAVLLKKLQKYFSKYDSYISTNLSTIDIELATEEIKVIAVMVFLLVILVLIITTRSYVDVPIMLLMFACAAIIQQGTNYMFGTISFVSNSITIVLQLALSVDYTVIYVTRYKEEREYRDIRGACIVALSKAIPEILGCSLTTIGGIISMLFMQFTIVGDVGRVLIKAIFISILCVFTLLPSLVMLFAEAIERTEHRSFIPKISFVGRFAYKTRYIIPPIFLLVIVIAINLSSKVPYVYGYSKISTPKENSVYIAKEMIRENFDEENSLVLIFPKGDYDIQKALIDELVLDDRVANVMGLANIEVMNGHTLTEKLTPRQFSELVNVDYEMAELIYTAYAVDDEDYTKAVNGIDNYKVPFIDMFSFVYKEVDEGYVTVGEELTQQIRESNAMISFAKNQLQGDEYDRIIINLNLPEESDETFAYIDDLHTVTQEFFPADDFYVLGKSVVDYDLKKCFARDNIVTSAISIISVLIILLFTFKSVGMPLLLIGVIQGCIWINFSSATITHDNIYFLSFLMVSAIQMGANIDYAIVIASRYIKLRTNTGKRAAIIETMNVSFPTIITSGTMLAASGVLIGRMTSERSIYGIGKYLGQGTIISILVTMFVLPQILLVGDKVIEVTSFFAKGNIDELKESLTPHKETSGTKLMSLILISFLAFNMLGMSVNAANVTDLKTGTHEKYVEHSYDVDADIRDKRLDKVNSEIEEIYISSKDDFAEFVKNCSLDTWSVNKKVILQNDIDLNYDFMSVPSFGGYFEGGGHTIQVYFSNESISNFALFSTLQDTGVISGLRVAGRILPVGEQAKVAGIVAINYGVINDCIFDGVISSSDYIGGIAGVNQLNGQILGCSSRGYIKGQHFVGGIVGENRGYVANCKNDALVNTSKTDDQVNMMSAISNMMNFVKHFNRNPSDVRNLDSAITDVGGIAGLSLGVIQDCINSENVGYEHLGYNVGGIAGRQSGYIVGCINNSKILGRKDVGGIVGQAEPFLTVDMNGSVANKLDTEINKLSNSISKVISDAKKQSNLISYRMSVIQGLTSSTIDDLYYVMTGTVSYSNSVANAANDVLSRADYIMDGVAGNGGVIEHSANAITDVVSAVNRIKTAIEIFDIEKYLTDEDITKYEEAKALLDNDTIWSTLRGAAGILSIYVDYLPKMTGDTRDQALTVINVIQKAMSEIEAVGNTISATADKAADGKLKKIIPFSDLYQAHSASLINNINSLNDNFGILNQEANNATGNLADDLQAVNKQFNNVMKLFSEAINGVTNIGDHEIYEDVSIKEVDSTTDATIENCSNFARVQADLDVGGIVGTMAIEYDLDRESDSTGLAEGNLTSKYITKCVLRNNTNYNSVIGEKNYEGGICGIQEMGTIKSCINYGDIKSISGEYVGGICGQSISYILASKTRGIVDGHKYVGGIAGEGMHISDSYSVVKVKNAKSNYGSIAGYVGDKGVVRNNYFVSDDLAGLDRVSYSLKAEPISITDENLPADLTEFNVSYILSDPEYPDGEILLKSQHKKYGESVTLEEYPSLPARAGYYVVWDMEGLLDIKNDEIITGRYVKYRTTIGEDTSGNSNRVYQSDILVDGLFKQDDVLKVEREYLYDVDLYENMNARINGVTDYESIKLVIPDDGQKTHQIRFKSTIELGDISYAPELFVIGSNGSETSIVPTGKMGNYNTYEVDGNDLNIAVRFTGKERVAYKYLFLLAMVLFAASLRFVINGIIKFRRRMHKTIITGKDTVAARIRSKEQIFYNDESESKEAKLKNFNVEGRRSNLPRVLKYIDSKLDHRKCELRDKMIIDLAVEEIYLNMVHQLRRSSDKNITVKYGFDKMSRSVTLVLVDTGEPYNEFADETQEDLLNEGRNINYLGAIMVLIAMDSFQYEYKGGQNIYKIVKFI